VNGTPRAAPGPREALLEDGEALCGLSPRDHRSGVAPRMRKGL